MQSVDSGRARERLPEAELVGLGGDLARSAQMLMLDDRLRAHTVTLGRVLDAAAVAGGGLLAWLVAHPGEVLHSTGFLLLVLQTLLVLNACRAFGLMDQRSVFSVAGLWGAPLLAAGLLLGLPALLAHVSGPAADWTWLSRWASLSAGLMLGLRGFLLAVSRRLSEHPRFARRVLVIGDPDQRGALLARLPEGAQPVEAEPGEVAGLLERDEVEEVILTLPWHDSQRMGAALATLRERPVTVHLLPESPEPAMPPCGVQAVAGVPMITLGLRPMGRGGALAKAALDRGLGVLALLALAPLLLIIALAIKLDSRGPVLFRQQRYGYNNQPFTVFKFRTMRPHAEKGGLTQASRNDPRVTRVGRFLRRTSLDELPQLLNVLNGSMSLVGPRPHAAQHHDYYQHLVDGYRCRHRMKPGITGLAQVHGYRGETQTVELMRKRVEYDLEYIRRWSLLLDLWILFITPFACLRGNNAY